MTNGSTGEFPNFWHGYWPNHEHQTAVTYQCPKCGRAANGIIYFNGETMCQICALTYSQGESARKGWICPVCGKGVSPNEKTCPCKV